MCKVVHWRKEDYDVYIGRGISPKTGKLSKWGCPYSYKEDTIAEFHVENREEAIQMFEEYLLNNEELMDSLNELKYKTLGCWCKPNRTCHGDIIKKYVDRLEDLDRRKQLLDD